MMPVARTGWILSDLPIKGPVHGRKGFSRKKRGQ